MLQVLIEKGDLKKKKKAVTTRLRYTKLYEPSKDSPPEVGGKSLTTVSIAGPWAPPAAAMLWAEEPVPGGGPGFLGTPAGAVFMNGSDGTPLWARGVTASPHCCYTRTALTGEQKTEWSGAAANSGKDNLGNYLILPFFWRLFGLLFPCIQNVVCNK